MILGLDLSSSCTGYGLIDHTGNVMGFGQIKPQGDIQCHGDKYLCIIEAIKDLFSRYSIDTVVLEMYFVGGFKTQGTFICAELRGAVKTMLARDHHQVVIAEDIFPSSLKKIITGNGRAEKIDVAKSILSTLGVTFTELKGKGSKCSFKVGENKYTDDVSDALSLAYCHWLKGKND